MAETTKRFCRIKGHNLAYHETGTGEVVLLVHGITTYSFIWRRIVPLLAPYYRVVVVDLLGCGESDKPLDVDYSLPGHAAMLSQFLDELGIGVCHFVGHDIGGGIGQVFAVRYPEKLIDFTALNSVGHNFWPVQPIVAMRTPIVRQLAMATLDIGALRLVVRRGLYHRTSLTDELLELFWQPMRTRDGRRGFLHFANCLNNRHLIEIEDDLKRLQLPVHIIRGDGDLYLSEAISLKLHRDIAGSRLTRIATAGHFMQEDEPQQIAASMLRFWRGDV
jgi:pimeloyl-ACP methyl ester carboxylesterase